MKVITQRDTILQIPKRWASQYPESQTLSDGSNTGTILKRLRKLDLKTCAPEDVDRIIGNDSWTTQLKCDECKEYVNWVLQVGDEPDYESDTACLCKACAREVAQRVQMLIG